MHRRSFLRQAFATAALPLGGLPVACTGGRSSPNIILIMTDDQGWTSVSYRSDPNLPGSRSDYVETPQMERAAALGMRFTDAYAPNPICSPTRHSVLFGQNAARHVYAKTLDWIPAANQWLTMPKVLKQADPAYRAAHFGKWHVGITPASAGFAFSDGLTSNRQGDSQNGHYKNTRGIEKRLRQYNAEHGITPPQLNDRYSKQPVFYQDADPKGAVSMTRRAEAFVRESVSAGAPFFAYINHFATHLDLVAHQETYAYFKNKKRGRKHDNPGYAAMAKDMDTAIGRVLDLAQELGIAGNTYIFITSDNGGVQHFAQSATLSETNEILETHETSVKWRNLPLRHGKHEFYEGGLRVPFLVLGPGIEPNSVCRAPVSGLDFLPTFAELAGRESPLPDTIDGDSIVTVLHNGGQGAIARHRDALIFHQAANRTPISAIRKGKYKLVKHWMAGQGCKYCGEKLLELYDLSGDLGETKDLAEQMPGLTAALDRELMAFLDQANAETEFADRRDAFSRLLGKRDPSDGSVTIVPEYVSPFRDR